MEVAASAPEAEQLGLIDVPGNPGGGSEFLKDSPEDEEGL